MLQLKLFELVKNDNSKTLVIPIEKIQEAVGAFYGVSVKEIKGSAKSSEYCPSTTSGHVSFKRDDGQLTASNRKRIRWERPHDCHSCL